MSELRLPTAAIVGRVNVGKSSLFNRMIEESKAITSPIAGTTRDIISGQCLWQGKTFTLLDTGGLDIEARDEVEKNILYQAKQAILYANVILLTVDIRTGLLPQDKELVHELAKTKKPIILVANKADNNELRQKIYEPEMHQAGLQLKTDVYPVSAANGTGTGDLLDAVLKKFEELKIKLPRFEKEEAVKITIIGKTNVGKSSLLNALLGKEVAIVSPLPYTTREPHDTLITYKNHLLLLVDTVGLRRKRKIGPGLEKLGAEKTIERIKNADIALLVIDISEPITGQDKRLARLTIEAEKGLVFVANKIDLLSPAYTENICKKHIEQLFPFLSWVPILAVSAKTGKGIKKIFDAALRVKENREKIIEDTKLEKFLREALKKCPPPKKGVRHPYIFKMTQTGAKPPTFLLSIKEKILVAPVAPAYLKYLEKKLRQEFDFQGTPLRINLKTIRL